MEIQSIFALTLTVIFFSVHSARFTLENHCAFTIWPGILAGSGKPVLSGFELVSQASSTLDISPPWSGRMWARTNCATNAFGKFTCATGDCGAPGMECNGAGGTPPASLVEFTLAENGGQDFYDVSLVDGFNLPLSITPQGGTGTCPSTSCPKNVNLACPLELVVKDSAESVIACKSACLAFNQPQYCCTGDFRLPETCSPTTYSKIFKDQCPQAYSYAYDDKSSTFTCTGGANYVITFCP
ncbi:thaumatin-like protein 1b isoform X2 [Mangifera indica]|uniref:thaumatin-like protein 1b isoform X2 n=1 Tax=Mangifera indica TaxID=29780 RepID=UPI001CF9619C|nr:thaumatin-like protein 1b isoform X2 [Mangifera indica]